MFDHPKAISMQRTAPACLVITFMTTVYLAIEHPLCDNHQCRIPSVVPRGCVYLTMHGTASIPFTISPGYHRSSPLPPIPMDDELRPPMPLPSAVSSALPPRPLSSFHQADCESHHSYGVISSCYSTVGSDLNDDYAEVSEKEFASKGESP